MTKDDLLIFNCAKKEWELLDKDGIYRKYDGQLTPN